MRILTELETKKSQMKILKLKNVIKLNSQRKGRLDTAEKELGGSKYKEA